MNKVIIIGVIFIFSITVCGQTAKFYEQAIEHLKCRNCYFIPVEVESKSYTGKILVENYQLFSYLKSTKGFDEQAYKSFIIKLFQDKQPLMMDQVNIDETGYFLAGKGIKEFKFRIVQTSQAFETVSVQGCKKIIQYYFSPELVESETNKTIDCRESIKQNAKDLLLKPKFDLNEENNVIVKLFEFDIPIYIDDISGSPIIGYWTLK
ncbi:MAG: hypothetical protein JSS81_18515 [Acidobacteria bacterium]|nr:hypothetical protein [Acidobacteriota bacterium]